MKHGFFKAAVVLILLYGCTTMDANKTDGEKAWQQLHKNAARNFEQVLGGNTPQSTNCTATYFP